MSEEESHTIWGPKGDRLIRGGVYALFAMFLVAAVGTAAIQGFEWLGEAVAYESTWSWWGGAYLLAGLVLGLLAGFIAFCWLWFWSASEGRFWGFAIGWIPSAIAGSVLCAVTIFLWGPAIVGGWLYVSYRG